MDGYNWLNISNGWVLESFVKFSYSDIYIIPFSIENLLQYNSIISHSNSNQQESFFIDDTRTVVGLNTEEMKAIPHPEVNLNSSTIINNSNSNNIINNNIKDSAGVTTSSSITETSSIRNTNLDEFISSLKDNSTMKSLLKHNKIDEIIRLQSTLFENSNIMNDDNNDLNKLNMNVEDGDIMEMSKLEKLIMIHTHVSGLNSKIDTLKEELSLTEKILKELISGLIL